MRTDEFLDARIRSAVPRDDDSNWRDVRRRAMRKRLPAALAAASILAILVAGPAFALRDQIRDLWAGAEPAENLFVKAYADCGQGSFTLEFHPTRGAVVRQNGDVLASASLTDRRIECDARIHTLKGTPDELLEAFGGRRDWRPKGPSYEPTALSCQTSAALRISVNPIWQGTIVGSSIGVYERDTLQPIASASLQPPDPTAWPGTARVYWSDACRRADL
jgi:hypothetical protein